MIKHHLKSADLQGKSRVRSASVVVVGEVAYMTVIPPMPIDPNITAGEQTRAIFAIIEERLASIGSDKRQIAHVTIWISHLLHFEEVTAAWNAWIDPDFPPVRACAQVNMANKDLKVEMIVVAHAPPA